MTIKEFYYSFSFMDARGGRDEVWDQGTVSSQLAKQSHCVVVSGIINSKNKIERIISRIIVFLAYRICLLVLKLQGKLKPNRVTS